MGGQKEQIPEQFGCVPKIVSYVLHFPSSENTSYPFLLRWSCISCLFCLSYEGTFSFGSSQRETKETRVARKKTCFLLDVLRCGLYPGSLAASTSTFSMTNDASTRSEAFSLSRAVPAERCASLPCSSEKTAKVPNVEEPMRNANQAIVAGSSFTLERFSWRLCSTIASFPGFTSDRMRSATAIMSCLSFSDSGRYARPVVFCSQGRAYLGKCALPSVKLHLDRQAMVPGGPDGLLSELAKGVRHEEE